MRLAGVVMGRILNLGHKWPEYRRKRAYERNSRGRAPMRPYQCRNAAKAADSEPTEPRSGWRILAGGEDGVKNLAIASAAADIAAERVLDGGEVGMGILLEQLGAGHEHAGNAEATLHGAVRDKGALQRVHFHVAAACLRGQPLDGGDAGALGLGGGHQTRHDGLTIQPDSTCPTLALGATLLDA